MNVTDERPIINYINEFVTLKYDIDNNIQK